MKSLQNMFENMLKETLTPGLILTGYIKKKLSEKGITLSKEQHQTLEKEINAVKDTPEQEETMPDVFENILKKSGIDNDTGKEIDLILQNAENDFSDFTNELVKKASKIGIEMTLEESLKLATKKLTKDVESILKIKQESQTIFSGRHNEIWGDSIKKLDFFVATSIECCRRTHENKSPIIQSVSPIMFNALGRLSARACQISSEIVSLLKAGFSDGAYARWRTLHEIDVTTLFIKKYGEETAKRYLHHYVVDTYETTIAYQNNCKRLGHEPIDDFDIDLIKTDYDQAILEYGDSFKGLYGWAAFALNLKKPTYKDIEKDVELNHLLYHYKYASSSIHATPMGIYNKLSLPESGFQSGLLTGPSMLGLEEPGQATAISLYRIITSYILIEKNIDNIHMCNVLQHFEQEAINSFIEVSENLNQHIQSN